jgi:hypothetical protein
MSVENNNKRNLIYFESDSMRGLYDTMETWQQDNGKRLLSTDIQREDGNFCCIALSNPSEVILVNGTVAGSATVSEDGYLFTRPSSMNVLNGPQEVILVNGTPEGSATVTPEGCVMIRDRKDIW